MAFEKMNLYLHLWIKTVIFEFSVVVLYILKFHGIVDACENNSLFQHLFFSGCGKSLALGHTLEWLPAREEKGYVMEDVQQQVGGAVLLSITKASQETVPKHP